MAAEHILRTKIQRTNTGRALSQAKMRLPDAFAGTPKQPWPARQPQLRRQAAGNLGGGIKTTPQYSGPAGRHGNQNHTLVQGGRSEERRVGKEWVSPCRSRW